MVGAQNFNFIGGSIGAASGEAFIHGVQNSIKKKYHLYSSVVAVAKG